MSYEQGKAYREYKLIEGINLLVNMVSQTKDERKTLKDLHETWINTGFLAISDQMDFISGTAADYATSKYLAYCMNALNSYMMSKYPNHRGLIRNLTVDILNAINMAVHANAHLWSHAQLEAIKAAFASGRVAKSTPYYVPSEEEEEEKPKRRKVLEYKPGD